MGSQEPREVIWLQVRVSLCLSEYARKLHAIRKGNEKRLSVMVFTSANPGLHEPALRLVEIAVSSLRSAGRAALTVHFHTAK